jgi:O-antigen/teichoic acid export membrane protein
MSVRKSMAWSLIGNIATVIAALASSVIVARLLTPAQMGSVAFGLALMSIVQSALQLSLYNYIVREVRLSVHQIGSVLGVSLIQGLVTSALIFACAVPAGLYQKSVDVTHVILLVAGIPILVAVENILIATWSRELSFRPVAMLAVIKALIQGVAGVICAYQGYGAASLGISYLIAAILGAAIGCYTLVYRQSIRPNMHNWRSLARFGGKSMAIAGIQTLNARAPEFILGRSINLAAVGLYNRASSSVDMVSRGAVQPIARVMLPALSNENARSGEIAGSIIRLSGGLTVLFWPILCFIALMAEPVITTVYGEQWRSAGPVLSCLCLVTCLQIATSGTGEAVIIRDRLGATIWIESARTVALFAIITLTAQYGLTMVAMGRFVEVTLATGAYLLLLRKIAGLSIRRWAKTMGDSATMTLTSVMPVLAFRHFCPQSSSEILQILMSGALFAMCFLASLFGLQHSLSSEVRHWVVVGRSWLTTGERST